MDALQLIEIKKTEIAKRVAKLRVQLEAAEADLRNLEITAETLCRLGLNPDVEGSVPRGQSYNHVLGVLYDSELFALTPREIYDALVESGVTSISQDNVRTILSRHKDRFESSDGRYWRKADEVIEPPKENSEGGSETALGAQYKENTEW